MADNVVEFPKRVPPKVSFDMAVSYDNQGNVSVTFSGVDIDDPETHWVVGDLIAQLGENMMHQAENAGYNPGDPFEDG